MISFRANLISKEYIRKKDASNSFSRIPVSFVKLDDKSKNEVKVVKEAVDRWSYGDEYGRNIFDCMLESYYSQTEVKGDKFFAITKQANDLDNLNSEDILALALLSRSSKGEDCIDFVQVEPKYVATMPEYKVFGKIPLYKEIGTAIFNGIENLFKEKSLYLFSLENTLNYYKNRGYVSLTNGPVYKMLLKR